MPYTHIEQIGDRSDERFALGLGARNLAGMVLAGLPAILISGSWPLLLRLLVVVSAIVLGFALTVDASGMPLYAWPLWWLRGRIRMLAQGRQITPDSLPGVARPQISTPLRVGGPIRPARRERAPRVTRALAAPPHAELPPAIDQTHKKDTQDAGLSALQLPA